MPEVADQQQEVEQPQGEQQQQQTEQKNRVYSETEWKARQAEFDSKAAKIRRNAAREAEARVRRELEAQRPQQQQQQQEDPDPEPKREEYDDYESYTRSMSRWEGRQGYRAEAKKAATEAEQRTLHEQAEKSAASFRERSNKAIKEIPDFAEVIEDAQDVMITPTMGGEIQDSPVGPRILYELAKNPDESLRISKLSVKDQRREILKMEHRYEAEAAAKAKGKDEGKNEDDGAQDGDGEQEEEQQAGDGDEGEERTRDGDSGRFTKAKPEEKETRRKAPDPIEPVTGRGGNSTSNVPTDKDSDEVWLRKRQAEIAREREAERKTRRAG